MEREIRKEILEAWSGRPLGDIHRQDVTKLVKAISDRPAPYVAHTVFGQIRAIFNFAIAQGSYGVERSPCEGLRPKSIIPPKKVRQRVLDDPEIRALYRAIGRLGSDRPGLPGGYPWRPFYELLILTGQRREDVRGMRWTEINIADAMWTIPPERFKSGKVHLVPLTDSALAISQLNSAARPVRVHDGDRRLGQDRRFWQGEAGSWMG